MQDNMNKQHRADILDFNVYKDFDLVNLWLFNNSTTVTAK